MNSFVLTFFAEDFGLFNWEFFDFTGRNLILVRERISIFVVLNYARLLLQTRGLRCSNRLLVDDLSRLVVFVLKCHPSKKGALIKLSRRNGPCQLSHRQKLRILPPFAQDLQRSRQLLTEAVVVENEL
jgi:hypothetical protein